MTEQEWLTSRDIGALLRFVHNENEAAIHTREATCISARKLRLFAVACCQRIYDLVDDDELHQAIEVAEQIADGQMDERDARQFGYDMSRRYPHYKSEPWSLTNYSDCASAALVRLVRHVIYPSFVEDIAAYCADAVAGHAGTQTFSEAKRAEQAAQCDILRDIVGNPFCPLRWDGDILLAEPCKLKFSGQRQPFPVLRRSVLDWQDRCIPKLAEDIYQSSDFSQMPILGDALEEAGCDDAVILRHCRWDKPHTRGCWLLDLLTNRC